MQLTDADLEQALRYLGCRGAASEELRAELAQCAEKLCAAARPRTVWRLFSRRPDGSLEGSAFHPQGQAIARHLQDCGAVILLAASLGAEVERLIRRAQRDNMSEALLLDALGSAAIENVCDGLCAELAERMRPRYLTERFSPGYGDFPLEQQRELFAALDVSRRIGVSLSEGGVMLPQKSVTALVGVSEHPQPQRIRGCAGCLLREKCNYRKDGKSCAEQ